MQEGWEGVGWRGLACQLLPPVFAHLYERKNRTCSRDEILATFGGILTMGCWKVLTLWTVWPSTWNWLWNSDILNLLTCFRELTFDLQFSNDYNTIEVEGVVKLNKNVFVAAYISLMYVWILHSTRAREFAKPSTLCWTNYLSTTGAFCLVPRI